MNWEPLSECEIYELINQSFERMLPEQRRMWALIAIEPQRWQQIPYGNEGGGFWVVAVIGRTVIWYNDIEEGFNRSHCVDWGVIHEYHCNQDQLEHQVQNVINHLQNGYDVASVCDMPQRGAYHE